MTDAVKPLLSPYRWVVLIVAMLAGFIGSYAQFQLPPLAYKLMPALHISTSQFAALMGGPMTGAIFVSILGGTLADRYGVKKIVTVGLILAVIGCTFRYNATSFWPFLFMSILAGMASALLTSNLSKLFGAWFPPEQMGTIIGTYTISPMLGTFLGTATTALFASEAGAFIFSGIACLAILIIWLVFAKNRPEGAPDLPSLPAARYLGKAARSRSVWLAGIGMFLVMGGPMVFSDFLPNVLRDLRGISPVQAGVYGSLGTFGGIFGCFLGPLICSRIGIMRPFIIIMGLLGAAASYWSWQLPIGPAIVLGMTLSGFLQSTIAPLLTAVPMLLPEIGPVYAGSAGGIISTLMVMGGVLVPILIAPLAGSSAKILFGLAAASFAFVILPALFLPELGTRALAARAGKASAK